MTIERSTLGLVRLGGTSQAGELGISGPEMQNITAAELVVGGTNTNLIEVDGITSAESDGITGPHRARRPRRRRAGPLHQRRQLLHHPLR